MSITATRRGFLKAIAALAGAAALPASTIEQLASAPAGAAVSVALEPLNGFLLQLVKVGDFHVDFGDAPLIVRRGQQLAIAALDDRLELRLDGLVVVSASLASCAAAAAYRGEPVPATWSEHELDADELGDQVDQVDELLELHQRARPRSLVDVHVPPAPARVEYRELAGGELQLEAQLTNGRAPLEPLFLAGRRVGAGDELSPLVMYALR